MLVSPQSAGANPAVTQREVDTLTLRNVPVAYGWTLYAVQYGFYPAALVGFDFVRLDRDAGHLSADVRVELPRQWLPLLLDAKTRRPVATRHRGDWYLKPRYRHEDVLLEIVATSSERYPVEVPFGEFFHKPSQGFPEPFTSVSRPISLEMEGAAGDYPSDAYSLGARVYLVLPKGVLLRLGSRSHNSLTRVLPTTLLARRTPSLRSIDLRMGAKEQIFSAFVIVASTPVGPRVVGYLLAFAPLLLVLAAIVFSRWGSRPGGRETVLALVGSVLSVPPLRVVLVPQDINGLTRLDWILLADVAFASMVAVVLLLRSKRLERVEA
jgi:hypothetical protein